MKIEKLVHISKEVKKAVNKGKAVVALESTIISHGMPYPQNIETALKVEQLIRDNGAVPATIAIIAGIPTVGLSEREIEYIAKNSKNVVKASRRDIPVLAAKGGDGATTVAATMLIAKMAGIKVFATGGIGGVHRGAETTMDISADLDELARTNVAVVCAGAKSILDLGLTMEYLETKGVPVIGYKTDFLPAFFTRESVFKVNYRMDSSEQIAKTIAAKYTMGIDGSVLVANPIPDKFSMDKEFIDNAIKNALAEADSKGIAGKDTTPFLLDKINKLTEGKSLASNIELVYNNAVLAAKIATELSKIS